MEDAGMGQQDKIEKRPPMAAPMASPRYITRGCPDSCPDTAARPVHESPKSAPEIRQKRPVPTKTIPTIANGPIISPVGTAQMIRVALIHRTDTGRSSPNSASTTGRKLAWQASLTPQHPPTVLPRAVQSSQAAKISPIVSSLP